MAAELAPIRARKTGARPEAEAAGEILVGQLPHRSASALAVVAGPDPGGECAQKTELERPAQDQSLAILLQKGMRFPGDRVGKAVAVRRREKCVAVAKARFPVAPTLETDFIGKVVQTAFEVARAHIIGLRDDALATQQIFDLELYFPCSGDNRKCTEAERASGNLAHRAFEIVDQHFHRRRLFGQAADGGKREGHEGGIGGEIGGPLDAAEAGRCGKGPRSRNAVAEPQTRASLRNVAREACLEANDLRIAREVAQDRA